MSKLNWFFCLNENRDSVFLDMAKAAVISTRNLDINRYCIYDGNNEKFIKFLEENNVKLFLHESSFKSKIDEFVEPAAKTTYYGAYLRVDIPLIIANNNLNIDRYLYTDCDVIFQKNPIEMLDSIFPKSICATGEYKQNEVHMFNSGVMWCNTESLKNSYQEFYNFVVENKFNFVAADQGALNAFYKHEKIDDVINWKPYWGINDDAYLIHFHGPKPHHYRMYLNEGGQTNNPHLRPYKLFINKQTEHLYKNYVKLYNIHLRDSYSE
jgi:hypothetical protein